MRTTLLAAALLSFAGLLPANCNARAQGTGTSGEIRGTVTDPTGGTVPKATVTVEDSEKGVRRSAATETDGAYRVTGQDRVVQIGACGGCDPYRHGGGGELVVGQQD